MSRRRLGTLRSPTVLARRRNQTFGGESDTQFTAMIGQFQSAEAANCDFEVNKTTGRTALAKRKGYTLTADDLGFNKPCLGLGSYNYTTGGALTRFHFSVFNDAGDVNANIFEDVGGAWTIQQDAGPADIDLTQGEPVEFVQANNELYVFNGNDAVWNYDGAAWTQLAAGTPLSGANNIGRFGAWYRNMMFVSGTDNNPSRLYVSDLGAPETFGANNFVDIGLDDGYKITGLGVMGDYLVVLKEVGVYLVSALSPTTIQVIRHSDSDAAGCISHRTVKMGRSHLYFMGSDGIYRMNVSKITPLHLDIQGFFDSLNSEALSGAAALFHDGRYRLAVPAGASTFNNREAVFFSDVFPYQWSINTGINAAAYNLFNDQDNENASPYFGEADAESRVYQLESGQTDNGTAIQFVYATKAFDMREPNATKHFKKVFVDAFASGPYNVIVEANIDISGWTQVGLLDVTGSGFILGAGVLGVTVLGGSELADPNRFVMNLGTGKRISLRFRDSNTVAQTKIYGFEIYYRNKRII